MANTITITFGNYVKKKDETANPSGHLIQTRLGNQSIVKAGWSYLLVC